MILIVREPAEEISAWVASMISHIADVSAFGPHSSLGVMKDGTIIAGIIYHNFIEAYRHCEISFAASSPAFATRGVIRALLSVPFEQYGCRTVSLLVPHDAARVKKFVSGIEFVRRGCLPEFFAPGRHGEVYSMTTKDYDRLRRRIG